MMTNFIREMANLIGCMNISERTEVRVFDKDELRVVFPECSSEPVYGGMRMTVGALEDALTSYDRDDFDGGYTSSNCIDEMEADDDGGVVLYGASKRMFEENIGLA